MADHQATLSQSFHSYDEGIAAGVQPVWFLRSGAVVQTGAVKVGACSSCVYAGCPSLDAIETETVQYHGDVMVEPESYLCFICSGGSASVKACP